MHWLKGIWTCKGFAEYDWKPLLVLFYAQHTLFNASVLCAVSCQSLLWTTLTCTTRWGVCKWGCQLWWTCGPCNYCLGVLPCNVANTSLIPSPFPGAILKHPNTAVLLYWSRMDESYLIFLITLFIFLSLKWSKWFHAPLIQLCPCSLHSCRWAVLEGNLWDNCMQPVQAISVDSTVQQQWRNVQTCQHNTAIVKPWPNTIQYDHC